MKTKDDFCLQIFHLESKVHLLEQFFIFESFIIFLMKEILLKDVFIYVNDLVIKILFLMLIITSFHQHYYIINFMYSIKNVIIAIQILL